MVPFVFRVADNEAQSGSIRDCGAVNRRRDDGDAGTTLKLRLDELADGRFDLGFLVERGAAVADDLLQRRLVVNSEPIGSDLADEKARCLQRARSRVDGS